MEDNHVELIISHVEHKILQAKKKMLESRNKVKICMPELSCNDCPSGEIIVVKIVGDRQNIGFVERYVKRKLESMKRQEKDKNNIPVVLIDIDSEDNSDNGAVSSQNKTCMPKKKKPRLDESLESSEVIPHTVRIANTTPDCEVTSTTNADESVIVLDPPVEELIPISASDGLEVLSQMDDKDESVIVLDPHPVEEFIPINALKGLDAPAQVDDEVIDLSSDEENTVDQPHQLQIIPRPLYKNVLRPVVIDGSNVARAHGKHQNTFSCKGIKICVDYFLKRGHDQVTAFVPLFRRHCKSGLVQTTDQYLLEELEKTQHLVFTPSRRIGQKAYSCYDDRFIVELATTNGGVILSNDNYKDLLGESPAFAEAITNRLLMFCFVGDMLMIPADPLGPRGPKLDEFLSFPHSV